MVIPRNRSTRDADDRWLGKKIALTRSVSGGLLEFGRWSEADELVLETIDLAVSVPGKVVGPALGGLVYVPGGPRPDQANHSCPPPVVPRQRATAMRAVQLANRCSERDAVVASAREVLASSGRTEIGTFWYATCALAYAGEIGEARWEAERASTEDLPGGEWTEIAIALLRGRLAHLDGDPLSALDLLAGLPERHDQARFFGISVAWTVAALVQLGRVEEAEALLERCGLDGAVGDLADRAELLYARGAMHLAAGRPQSASTDFLDSGRELSRWAVTNPAVLPWRSQAAIAAHELRRRSLAVTLAHEELVLARRWEASRPLGVALHAMAVVSGDQSDPDLLAEASRLLADADAVAEQVRVDYERGVVLMERRQYAAARSALRSARACASRMGSPEWMRRADEAMRYSAEHGNQPDLTPQERRVADLARAGHTNREIAQQLDLASRTVEFHLSAVYRKLGMSGRADLLRTPIRPV